MAVVGTFTNESPWVLEHPWDFNPFAVVVDADGYERLTSPDYSIPGQVTIYWDEPTSGTLTLIGYLESPEPEDTSPQWEAAGAEKPSTPHLAFPLRLDNTGRAVEVEQDSALHLADRMILAAKTRLGLRDDDPEFGRPEDVFRAGGVDMAALRNALAESEPDCAHVLYRVQDPTDLRRDRLALMIQEEGEVDG